MKFIENRKKFFIFSIAVILIGLLAMVYNAATGKGAFNYGIEFKGGSIVQVDIGKEFDIEKDIKPIVEQVLGKVPTTITTAGETQVIITTPSADVAKRKELVKALTDKYQLTEDDLLADQDVSPSISPEIRAKAVQAVVLGSILMLIYIWIRFKDFKFGASAVIALVHDVLVMLMVYAVFRIPLNNSFIAAILTIVGYSINDTIIVFDRIRENKGKIRGADDKIINDSINQTLSRSINTSITTLVMVVLLYVMGVSTVKEFAFPLVIGILSGTYSSIFVASPLWYEMKKRKKSSTVKGKKQPKTTK